jgi:hypothetical protein
MESLSPNVFVRDMQATIHFYEQLGFQVLMTVPEAREAVSGPPPVLQKTFYGATEFSILDNNNYVLTFAEDEAE